MTNGTSRFILIALCCKRENGERAATAFSLVFSDGPLRKEAESLARPPLADSPACLRVFLAVGATWRRAVHEGDGQVLGRPRGVYWSTRWSGWRPQLADVSARVRHKLMLRQRRGGRVARTRSVTNRSDFC